MFIIDEIQVDSAIARTYFACDIVQCKGACCTMPGGRGAPLADAEVEEIYKAYPIAKKYLSEEHRAYIEQHGLVEGTQGSFATQCVDHKDCVFIFYENNIALCAFEKSFHEKEILWQKPLSCHLFPIRVHPAGTEIHFEFIEECHSALTKGTAEQIPLHTFVQQPLERAFGPKWIQQLNNYIETHL